EQGPHPDDRQQDPEPPGEPRGGLRTVVSDGALDARGRIDAGLAEARVDQVAPEPGGGPDLDLATHEGHVALGLAVQPHPDGADHGRAAQMPGRLRRGPRAPHPPPYPDPRAEPRRAGRDDEVAPTALATSTVPPVTRRSSP